MQVKLKQIHPNAKTPTYATDGSGCFDLYAAETGEPWRQEGYHNEFNTGLAFEIPEGHVMLMFGRSGIAFNYGAHLVTGVSVIDSDFRGEVKVKYTIGFPSGAGDRIAQAIVLPYEKVEFVEEELSETERGDGGFGSSGS